MKRKSIVVFLLPLLAAACAADDDDRFEELAASMEGIYEVGSYTENLDACVPGDDSVLDDTSDTYLLAISESLFGTRFLTMLSCESPAACRQKSADIEAGEIVVTDYAFAFHRPGDNGTVAGDLSFSGSNSDGTCSGGIAESVAALAGAELTIRVERTLADDFPTDAEGFCTTDLAAEAAADNSCSQMENLRATFVEAL